MRRLIALLGLVALLAAACAPINPDADAARIISVTITQGRTDRDGRVIVIDVTNHDDLPIELVHAQLDTPQFIEPAVWQRGTTLKPGLTVSLRSPLADPVCPVPAGAEPVVAVTFLTADGASHAVTVEPTQPTGILATIAMDDCIAALAARHADIRVSDSVEWMPGAHAPARLTITVTPLDAPGSMTIVQAQDTIMLGLIGPDGIKTQSLPLGIRVTADATPTRIDLELVPNRCDPHAVAEDKRGTLMPLTVETSEGLSGVAFVRASDAVRGSLYDFVGDYCGF